MEENSTPFECEYIGSSGLILLQEAQSCCNEQPGDVLSFCRPVAPLHIPR